jgi:hypothetical protein
VVAADPLAELAAELAAEEAAELKLLWAEERAELRDEAAPPVAVAAADESEPS